MAHSRLVAVVRGLMVIALAVAGAGALGLVIGVAIDKQYPSHHLDGLGGLLIGTPTGAFIGLVLAIVALLRLDERRQNRLALFLFGAGVVSAFGLFLLVQLEVVRW